MTQFYKNFHNADIERLAKSMCEKLGVDPLSLVPDNGYLNAPLIPRWWKEQEHAARLLVAKELFTKHSECNEEQCEHCQDDPDCHYRGTSYDLA